MRHGMIIAGGRCPVSYPGGRVRDLAVMTLCEVIALWWSARRALAADRRAFRKARGGR